tara:strand:+ start:18 stop:470 length:453 start_codon:yes stop_codon:yes gene_type:complete
MTTVRYALTFTRCKILMATARNKDNGKPIGNNTRLYEIWYRGNVSYYEVQLHGHVIMEVHRDGYVIDSCGWRSVTTKARLNRYLPDEFHIRQKNYYWWVFSNPNYTDDEWKRVVEFTDGMFLCHNGKVYDNLSAWKTEAWPKWEYDGVTA